MGLRDAPIHPEKKNPCDDLRCGPGEDCIVEQCRCRPGVGGTKCDHCVPGFWGIHLIAKGALSCTPLPSLNLRFDGRQTAHLANINRYSGFSAAASNGALMDVLMAYGKRLQLRVDQRRLLLQ
ncbi:unnamed protein product, partial [Mesorhabditis spiculigera]